MTLQTLERQIGIANDPTMFSTIGGGYKKGGMVKPKKKSSKVKPKGKFGKFVRSHPSNYYSLAHGSGIYQPIQLTQAHQSSSEGINSIIQQLRGLGKPVIMKNIDPNELGAQEYNWQNDPLNRGKDRKEFSRIMNRMKMLERNQDVINDALYHGISVKLEEDLPSYRVQNQEQQTEEKFEANNNIIPVAPDIGDLLKNFRASQNRISEMLDNEINASNARVEAMDSMLGQEHTYANKSPVLPSFETQYSKSFDNMAEIDARRRERENTPSKDRPLRMADIISPGDKGEKISSSDYFKRNK